jgi:hypothetical protein
MLKVYIKANTFGYGRSTIFKSLIKLVIMLVRKQGSRLLPRWMTCWGTPGRLKRDLRATELSS